MAGLLDYDPQAAKQQALYSGLLGMGAQLLANSGRRYSTTPGAGPGLGAALGQGLLGFQQGADSSMRDSMQGALFGMKMDEAQRSAKQRDAWDRRYGPTAATVAGVDGGLMGNAPSGTDPEMASLLYSLGPVEGPKFMAERYAKTLDYQDKATYEPGIAGATEAAKNAALRARAENEYRLKGQYQPGIDAASAAAQNPALAQRAGMTAGAQLPYQQALAQTNANLDVAKAGPIAAAQDGIKAPGKLQETEMKLSGDFNGSPVVKNYREASTAFMGIMDSASRDSKASDLNLVYGLAKLFDPGSVVREGEAIMVQRTGGLSDQVMGLINSVNGGARLTPEIRSGIVAEARGRMEQQQSMYDAIASHFESVASQYGAKPENVIPMPAMRIVKDDADFEKLRSGSMFVGPDGQLRRKP